MSIWTFTVCWNESQMAPWFLRHYEPWVDRMVIWCEPSTDGTEQILRSCPKVDLRTWPYLGLDDEAFLQQVNRCYWEARGKAEWCAFVDMDELLYHPNMAALLSSTKADVIQAKGYALISKHGWPEDDGKSQLWERVTTGVPQANYDKFLLHRPNLHIIHTIGRHTYPGHWPKHNGVELRNSGLKLLHCHNLGGVAHTCERNKRNYVRACNKKYAWNMVDHNPAQVGTTEWVEELLKKDALIHVI